MESEKIVFCVCVCVCVCWFAVMLKCTSLFLWLKCHLALLKQQTALVLSLLLRDYKYRSLHCVMHCFIFSSARQVNVELEFYFEMKNK